MKCLLILLAFSGCQPPSEPPAVAPEGPPARKCPAGPCEPCPCVDESKCPGCCAATRPYPLPKPVNAYAAALDRVRKGERLVIAHGVPVAADAIAAAIPDEPPGVYDCWLQDGVPTMQRRADAPADGVLLANPFVGSPCANGQCGVPQQASRSRRR